ncbi:MAG TPA: LysM peptidoglycan-binding domain-containing protein [Allosphingosinicella sp.]|nr:LysM peptidoglycan-binding domain-containing protein [Allosphingosinicella sp.]
MSSPPPGRASIVARWNKGQETIPVQYNPTELVLEKKVTFAEIGIPGLTAPLQQFVRGNAEVLTVELFCDTSDKGMGSDATSVATETDKIYSLARIDPDGHAPPIVEFHWGSGFPGSNLNSKLGNQKREHFVGIVSSIRQTFTLFSAGGIPLRAKLSLTITEYQTLDDQLTKLNLKSPDRTHGHVVQAGDQLWSIAHLYYERPSAWREIAVANRIEDPRRLKPGRALSVPSIDKGAAA